LADFTVTTENRVARISINAPPRNVLTAELQAGLRDAVCELARTDDHNVLVLESALPDFSAGADVAEHIGREATGRMLKAAHSLISAVLAYPVPVLAGIRGMCLGGGFELVLACDRVIADATARVGLPEIRLGCFPPAGMVLAPQKLGALVAARLVTGGEVVPAAEVPGIEIADVNAKALEYANLPRGPLTEATRLLRSGAAERFEAAVGGLEQAYLERILSLRDAEEGPRAFLEKRKPVWDHKGFDET
jgi:cyclohexa-1,5-dienecarbonyl-CoA hydratase